MHTQNEQASAPAGAVELEQGGFYVQDVDFRSGIVPFQAPGLMAVVAAVGGFVPPDPGQPFVYCDLGCGDGTTTNALASVYPDATFIGVDFNAGHIATARQTAEQCGLSNVRFIQTAFSELAEHDLPSLDFVGMNGIYAWLEEPEAAAVRAFLAERLKPGGLFYVEYTSLPGKVSVQPLWGLIQHLVPPRPDQDSRERARQALDLTENLAKRGMAYLSAHRPAANGAQSYIRGRKRDPYRVDHFAHNAMASGFRPRYFTEMHDEMAAVGLAYAGRCELALNDIETSVPPAQVPTFQDYKGDVRTVELLKDYVRNEQQRHDVFVRAGTPDREAADAFLDRELRVSSRVPAGQVQRALPVMGGHRIPLRGPAFEAVILAADGRAVSPAEVAEAEGLPVDRVRRAALRLLAGSQFVLCRADAQEGPEDTESLAAIDIPNPVNRRTLALAAERLTQNQLVSPVTRGPAIPVSALEAVLLQATLQAGGFDGAVAAARDRLAEETRPLPSPNGQKPAKDIPESDLAEVLKAMRGRKLLNMLRLGVAVPA